MKRIFTFSVLTMLVFFGVAVPNALAVTEGHGDLAVLGVGIASALTIALAAALGGLAQGRATAAAVEGIARNPGAASAIQTPLIIGLALIESLVIYALLIAFLLQGKI